MDIPNDITIVNIMNHLNNKDKLALAMTSKDLYQYFFERNEDFRKKYSRKHEIAQCFHDMYDFAKSLNASESVYWRLSMGNKLSFEIGSKKNDIHKSLNWFQKYMLPKWDNLVLTTNIISKDKYTKTLYTTLTNTLLCHLSYSV